MPANRGPTVNKRQRERARDEKRRKKAEKKQQRAAEKAAQSARGEDDGSSFGAHETDEQPLDPVEDEDGSAGPSIEA